MVGEARVRRVLCFVASTEGDYALARQHVEIAIPLAREAGNDVVYAYCLMGFAEALTWAGELDHADQRLQQALDSPAAAIPKVDVYLHLAQASVLYERADYAAAKTTTHRVLRVATEHTFVQSMIDARLALARLDCAVGDADGATAHLDNAEVLNPDSAHMWDDNFLAVRSEIALVRGQNSAALRLAEHAAAIADETNIAAQCFTLVSLGAAQLACDQYDSALATFEQVIDKAELASMRCRQAEGHEGAAAACAALGRAHEAYTHLAAANDIRHATNSTRQPRRPVEDLLATLADQRTTDLPDGRAAAGQTRRHP